MKSKLKLLPAAIACLLLSGPVLAAEHGGHDMHNPDQGNMAAMANEAGAGGRLHRVDVENNMVNISHEPIPALNWPQMTMDLPTTNRVDLSRFKAGDQVQFTLKKGRDNQFRIISMEPAPAPAMSGEGEQHNH